VGESNYFAMQLCMLMCGLLGVVIIYRQRWIWTTRFQACWVVFATAMSYCFYHNIQRILTESPSFLLFWVIIALLWAAKTNKWYLLLAGLTAYAAFFTRMPAILPIAAVGIAALFERRLISEKFWWRFLGAGVLAIGVVAGWYHVGFIAKTYQQATPYSSGGIFNITSVWFTVVNNLSRVSENINNVGRLFSNLVLAQRNWAVGWGVLVLMTLGAWRCYYHRSRKLIFPMVFVVVYAVLLIASQGSWTMMARYWFFTLPFVIYYLFKSFELLGGVVTKVLRLRRPLLPLPKFAAILICILLLVQFPLIVWDNFVSIYSWSHSPQQFYEKFNGGRDAEIMSLASELAKEKSDQWIAASNRASILMTFTGRNVHDMQTGIGVLHSSIKPLEVIRSEKWQQHPPGVVLIRRSKSKDASEMQAYNQLVGVFTADRENWTQDKETKCWVIFRRKINRAKPAKRKALD